MKSLANFLIAAGLLLSASVPAFAADDFTTKSRAAFEKYKNTVVTVQIVIRSKVTVGGNDQSNEVRQEITGTVIDPSGLVVVSLSVTDPGQFVRRMLSEDNRVKIETELADVKLLLADGSELPAEVVLRDADLDLAFIRPKAKPSAAMDALDLSNSAKAEVLDQIISINRLGRAAGRVHAAATERISAIMQRPRLLYVPMGGMTTSALGSPAITPDGKVLGIFVVRSIREGAQSGGNQPGNITATIIPAAEVLKVSKQAPEAGSGESSSTNKTDTASAPEKPANTEEKPPQSSDK